MVLPVGLFAEVSLKISKFPNKAAQVGQITIWKLCNYSFKEPQAKNWWPNQSKSWLSNTLSSGTDSWAHSKGWTLSKSYTFKNVPRYFSWLTQTAADSLWFYQATSCLKEVRLHLCFQHLCVCLCVLRFMCNQTSSVNTQKHMIIDTQLLGLLWWERGRGGCGITAWSRACVSCLSPPGGAVL